MGQNKEEKQFKNTGDRFSDSFVESQEEGSKLERETAEDGQTNKTINNNIDKNKGGIQIRVNGTEKAETKSEELKNIDNYRESKRIALLESCISAFPKRTPFRKELFPEDTVKKYLDQLRKNHFILICSPSEKANTEMVNTLLASTGFKNKNSVHFDLEKYNRNLGGHHFFLDLEIGRNEAEIVIAEIGRPQHSKIIATSELQINIYTEVLREKKRHVILVYRSTDSESMSAVKKPNFYFELDFLRTFLFEFVEKTANEVLSLEKKIQEQRSDGLWEHPKNDFAFYNILCSYVDRGSLLEHVTGRIDKTSIEEVKTIKANALVDFKDSTGKVVVFLATYFPNLKLKDFRGLVDFYTRKKDALIPLIKKKGKSGKRKKLPISFTSDWVENYNSIFKAKHLGTRIAENKQQIVGFLDPYLQGDLKHYFETYDAIYVQTNFEYLLYSDFFLLYEGSSGLLASFVKLLASMASKDPEHYGTSTLIDIILQDDQRREQIRSKVVDNSNKEHWVKVFSRNRTRLITRLADLIHEILKYDHLDTMVENFFDLLIHNGFLDVLLDLIEEVSERENYSQHFDMYRWLKKIIVEDVEGKYQQYAYQLILQLSTNENANIHDVLEVVSEWKEAIKSEKDFKLRFFEYCSYYIHDLALMTYKSADLSIYGVSPPAFLFFKSLTAENNSEYIDRFTKLLFDKSIYTAIFINIDFEEDNIGEKENVKAYIPEYITRNIAKYIEEYHLILTFDPNGNDTGNANNSEILTTFISAVVKNATKEQYKMLIAHLRLKKEEYLQHSIQLLRENKRSERKNYQLRRQYLIELLKLFNQANKENRRNHG